MEQVYMRMAELYQKRKHGTIRADELVELDHCMQLNLDHCWKKIILRNLSLAAHMTNDNEWQHEICAKIEGDKHDNTGS
jgi:hypothetical protein